MSTEDTADLAQVGNIIKSVWKDFVDLFDVKLIIDDIYSENLIDDSVMEQILSLKADTKEANRHFLLYLRKSATIDTLKKLRSILEKTAKDHDRHKRLGELLESKLPRTVSIFMHIKQIT
jgi:hypothetical protein